MRELRAFGLVCQVFALAALFAYGVDLDPARWAPIFYDRGGPLRLVEIFATDIVGTHALALFFAFGTTGLVARIFDPDKPFAFLRWLWPPLALFAIGVVIHLGPRAYRRAAAAEFPANQTPNVLVIVASAIAEGDVANAPALSAFGDAAARFTRAYASREDAVEPALVALSLRFEAAAYRIRFGRDDVDETLAFTTDAPAPFFAVTTLTAASAPYSAQFPAYEEIVEHGYRGRFKYAAPTDVALAEPMEDADHTQIAELKHAAIATTDAAIGRLVNGLRDRGLDERTVIVVIGDHGETLGVAGPVDDARLRIPLVIREPQQRPTTSATAVDERDVTGTLLHLIEPRPDAPGPVDLADALRGEHHEGRAVVLRGAGEALTRDWAIIEGDEEVALHPSRDGLDTRAPDTLHAQQLRNRLITQIMREEALDLAAGHFLPRPPPAPLLEVLPYSVVVVLGGQPVPPAIAALGTTFTSAHAPATTPIANHAALLTGAPPWELGAPPTEQPTSLEIARFAARCPPLLTDVFAAHGAFVARDPALDQTLPLGLARTAQLTAALFEVYAPHRFFFVTRQPIAEVLRDLEEAHAAETTIVVATADVTELPHAKVPLFLALPRRGGAGVVTATPVSLLDVAPTILTLEGLPAGDGPTLLAPVFGRAIATEGRGERGVCVGELCYLERDNGAPREALYDGPSPNVLASRAEDAAKLRDALGIALAKAVTKDARQSAALAGSRFTGGDGGPPAVYELRFAGGGGAHRVAGEITSDDPEAKLVGTLVDGDPDAVRNTNGSVSFATSTVPAATVLLRVRIAPRSARLRWSLSWDDAPIAESGIFLGPRGLHAGMAAGGIEGRDLLRLTEGGAAVIDPLRDRGVFVSETNAWMARAP